MSFEQIALNKNFEECEKTEIYRNEFHELDQDQEHLYQVKKLQENVTDLKKVYADSLKATVQMVWSIDDNSKKIVYKHFDQDNVNLLSKRTPALKHKLKEVKREFMKKKIITE